jgi:hypothetical protein
MHPEILSKEQKELLPLMQQFKREFYLVGGTAIALQIGHRKSIDFDMFKFSNVNSTKILKKIDTAKNRYTVIHRNTDQIHLIMNTVKLTFFQYPYPIDANVDFEKIFKMPDLLTLSAMKAFALGRRAKWKDYVDLCFLLRGYYTLDQISQKADDVFGPMFSKKMFRSQLMYHKNIDYSEPVEYLPGFEIDEREVKNFLINQALQGIKL